jgi:hypothetical protein
MYPWLQNYYWVCKIKLCCYIKWRIIFIFFTGKLLTQLIFAHLLTGHKILTYVDWQKFFPPFRWFWLLIGRLINCDDIKMASKQHIKWEDIQCIDFNEQKSQKHNLHVFYLNFRKKTIWNYLWREIAYHSKTYIGKWPKVVLNNFLESKFYADLRKKDGHFYFSYSKINIDWVFGKQWLC